MEISRETKKHLMQIIAFAILLYCGIEHLDIVIAVFRFTLGIVMPFVIGGIIAFILNVPMKRIEKHLFVKNQKGEKFRRPLAYLLTLLCVLGVFMLASMVIAPELGNTASMLMEQIPVAFRRAQRWLAELPEQWPALAPAIEELNIDWSAISSSAVKVVQGIASGVVSSGMGLFSGVVSGVTTFIISFTFSIYVLFQKEKLAGQAKQVLYAVFSKRFTEKSLEIAKLSNQIFSSFLSGQCMEAVILGTMFFIAMSIFGMPYAMMTGIVIAITALIPIFGAFIGCVMGMFLIAMVNPMQAVWFLILFLVLQQVEGNLIYPHVVGGSIGLPSIWVLVAVTLGGKLFGIAGILFFIPLCSVLYALFRTFVKKRLAERSVPPEKWQKPEN